jgi:hypothetical protein
MRGVPPTRPASSAINLRDPQLQRSLEFGPDVPTTHLWLAQAYMDAKEPNLARKELEWLVKAKPRAHREKEDAADKKKAEELLKKLEGR